MHLLSTRMAHMFTVLLAKACVSICVLMSFRLHEDESQSMNMSWYASTLVFSLMLIIDLNRYRLTFSDAVAILVVTLFWCHTTLVMWIFQSVDLHTREFIFDSVVPYVQYRKILNCVLHDIITLLKYFKRMNECFGISYTKFVGFLVYLSIHAGTFIFIFELIFFLTFQQMYVTFSENFFYSFDINRTTTYPDGYLYPMHLNVSAYGHRFPVKQINSYSNDIASKCERTNHYYVYNLRDSNDIPLPYRYISIKRYKGEDVTIKCAYVLKTPRAYLQTIWTLNGSLIETKKDAHIIETNTHKHSDGMDIYSELKVRLIGSSGFGVYACVLVALEDQDSFESVYTKTQIAVYNITMVHQKLTVIYRTVGNLIASQNFFFYHTSDDVADIYAMYMINGRPVEQVCPGYSTKFCSVGAGFTRSSIRIGNSHVKWYGETNFPYIDVAGNEHDLDGKKTAVVYYCMCNQAYGIHKVRFVRKMVSKTSNRTLVVDVEHPFVFLVLPRSQRSLFRYTDHSDLYSGIIDLVEQNASLEQIEDSLEHVIKYIHAIEEDAAFFANSTQSIFIVLVLIVYFVLMRLACRYYFYLFIELPVRQFLPLPGFSRSHIKDNVLEFDYYLHDVFVSFSDKDSDFVSVELIPFLEESCNVKVCHPDRDMHSGQTQFSLYKEHITKSRYIIIILSQGYKEDRMCQNLQLQHIILPLLYEEKRNRQEMLFILYDEGAVFPDILRWNFEVEKLDWRRNCSQERKLAIVKQWLDSLTSN